MTDRVAEEIRFTRIDSGQAVDVAAQLQSVPFAPQTVALMQKCLDGGATPQETAEFRECWQARVRTLLLLHGDDPEVFVLRPLPSTVSRKLPRKS